MDAPLFIVGANRSGTTLLRLILNAHSEVAIPDEIRYFYAFRGGAGYEHWRTPNLSPDQYREFVDDFLQQNEAVTPELDFEALRNEILAGPHDLRRPYQLLLERWAHHHGKSRWGEKTPGNLFFAHLILSMFPDAKFLHLVRDPRAVVHSMQKVKFFPDDLVFNALNLKKVLSDGRSRFEQDVPPDQRLIVRYEDLVHAPEPTIRYICEFAELKYEAGMLAFHEDASQYMTDEASNSFNTTATRPISTARTSAWRSHLTTDEVAIVELLTQSTMREFDYQFDGHRPPIRRWPELALKYIYWRFHCWRNRHIPQYVLRHEMLGGLRSRIRRWASPLRHLRSCLQQNRSS